MIDARISDGTGNYVRRQLPAVPSVGHGVRLVAEGGYVAVTGVLWDLSGPSPVVWIGTRPPPTAPLAWAAPR